MTTYKIIETISYVNTVEVEAEDKQEAWSKAFEGGEMSTRGNCVDIFTNNIIIKEVKDNEQR